MNAWEDAELAWELADLVRPSASRGQRMAIYAQIGAGDPHGAMETLLDICVRRSLVLPEPTVDKMTRLLSSYEPSEIQLLRTLVGLLQTDGTPRMATGAAPDARGNQPSKSSQPSQI